LRNELGPTPVFEDNTAVIRCGRDIGLARASRTLAQHFQLLRVGSVAVAAGWASSCHHDRPPWRALRGATRSKSTCLVADLFTKPVGTTKFQVSVERLGISVRGGLQATD
jgi:hypothetical protein